MRARRWTLINALQVTEASYRQDAEAAKVAGIEGLKLKFEHQAKEVADLARQIEVQDIIHLED